MSQNIVKPANDGVVPFFARFLEVQAVEGTDTPSYPFTFKYPSDLEDS